MNRPPVIPVVPPGIAIDVARDFGKTRAAFVSAIERANDQKRAIYVRPDHYEIDGTIPIPYDGIHIFGDGYGSRMEQVTVQSPTAFPGQSVFDITGADDITIQGLRITGERTSDTQAANHIGILARNCNRMRLVDLIIQDFSGMGILMSGHYTAAETQGVHDSWVRGCYVSRCNAGIFAINDAQRIKITGNNVYRCLTGIFLDDSHTGDGSEVPRAAKECLVQGNTVSQCYLSGIALAGSQQNIIDSNIVIGQGQATNPAANAPGIVLQTAQNLEFESRYNKITNNYIAFSGHMGINLSGASFNDIVGNTLRNNSYNRASGGTSQIDLRLQNVKATDIGSDSNYIAGNRCYTDDVLSTVGNSITIADSTCTGNIVMDNPLSGGGSNERISNSGTGTIARNNGVPSTITITAGAGAGTGPTVSISGNERAGFVNITTGTTPSASAIAATINYIRAYPVAIKSVNIQPVNAAAAALSGAQQVHVPIGSLGTASFTINSGSTELAATTQYRWTFTVHE